MLLNVSWFVSVNHLLITPNKSSQLNKIGVHTPVVLDSTHGQIFLNFSMAEVGAVGENTLSMLSALLTEPDLHLQLSCTTAPDLSIQCNTGRNTKRTKNSSKVSTYLSVIVYGPMELFDDIGKFFDEYQLYLQDPYGCDRNMRYRNPHRISGRDPVAPMTFELRSLAFSHEETVSPCDILAGFESDEILPESESPPALKTVLYPHQKQALSFMLRRECGWRLHDPQSDLWRLDKGPLGSHLYINNITEDAQIDPPPQFRGGILADHMGLGKTLSMIALIASDYSNNVNETMQTGFRALPQIPQSRHLATTTPPLPPRQSEYENFRLLTSFAKTTLLIVPPSLLQSWEAQLAEHLHSGKIIWTKHHGSQRLRDQEELQRYGLVITTFQTVSSEYRKLASVPSVLFTASWHRVILDEAHCIRNRNTITTKAVCAIESTSRWAMTGTPLQNRLTDFATLLQFLDVYPYSKHSVFEAHIIDMWKAQGEEAAIDRLKKLVKILTLRRSRATIQLPERVDHIQHLTFSPTELIRYRDIEAPIVEMLDATLEHEDKSAGIYLHALSKINTLRKFCNLGLSELALQTEESNALPNISETQWNPKAAGRAFEALAPLGETACALCSLDPSAASEDRLGLTVESPLAHLTRCLRLICDCCYQQNPRGTLASVCICDMQSSCALAAVSMSSPVSAAASPRSTPFTEPVEQPTKIQALAAELGAHGDEKSVVFSSWTTTLDLVQSMLEQAPVPFVRVDGRVSSKKRGIAFDQFRDDPSIKVLLLSISCGAEGLNLTAATHAYLMEPQWNPTLEEQALARIHRLGQTKKVTTTRFIMKDSIEEHVVNVQNRKKSLADLLLSQEQLSMSDVNRTRLQQLRSLLG